MAPGLRELAEARALWQTLEVRPAELEVVVTLGEESQGGTMTEWLMLIITLKRIWGRPVEDAGKASGGDKLEGG